MITQKYEIILADGNTINVYKKWYDRISYWIRVKLSIDIKREIFHDINGTYGTGHEIKHNIKEYIGTFQLLEYGFVFHLFEVELDI